MEKLTEIRKMLYRCFSVNAVMSAAYNEMSEDMAYCIKHKMNHMNGGEEEQRWNALIREAERYDSKVSRDEKNFALRMMQTFRKSVDDIMRERRKKKPTASMYDGLNEIDRFAVRRFYYYDMHL